MIYRFGAYELDEARRELRRDGRPVAIQPKPLALLALLLRESGRVVPSDEILATLWPDTVVTPGSLNRAVTHARRAIGGLGFWSLPELGVVLENRVPLEARSGMALWSPLSAVLGTGLVGHAFVLGQRRAERELAVANAELFRESAYVQLLMHAAVSANEAVSLDTAMREAVVRICQSMGWEVGHIGVRADDGTLVSSGFHHASDLSRFSAVREYALTAVYRPGQGLAGAVLATGRPRYIADLAALAERVPASKIPVAAGLRTAYALPVLVHGEVRAVLEFGSSAPAPGGGAPPPAPRCTSRPA